MTKTPTKTTVRTDRKDYSKLKAIAENLFITQDQNSKQIAEITDVSQVTISTWRKEGKWDEKKDFERITPTRLRMTLLKEAERVANGEESTIKADTIVKLLAGADKLAAKITPDLVFTVLYECCKYIATADPDFALKMAEHHKLFLQHKIQQDG